MAEWLNCSVLNAESTSFTGSARARGENCKSSTHRVSIQCASFSSTFPSGCLSFVVWAGFLHHFFLLLPRLFLFRAVSVFFFFFSFASLWWHCVVPGYFHITSTMSGLQPFLSSSVDLTAFFHYFFASKPMHSWRCLLCDDNATVDTDTLSVFSFWLLFKSRELVQHMSG